MILVARNIDRRDLSLPEGIIKRVIDLADRDLETGCGIAVDHQLGLQGLVLLIAADISKNRHGLKRSDELWCPFIQLIERRALQRVLIRRIGRTSSSAEISNRLQEQR